MLGQVSQMDIVQWVNQRSDGMTNEEAIKALEYMISEECDDSQWMFIDEVEYAIQALRSRYQKLLYEPACKFGYADCIYDPAYIKFDDPEWYTELYGDVDPSEVDDCYDCNNGSRYDDEDK